MYVHSIHPFLISVGKPITIADGATTPIKWWCKDLDLTEDDRFVLMDNKWLSDKHMSAAANLLKIQFPESQGFQSTITETLAPAMSDPYYQFHFYNSHWCASWIRDGTVSLCNSLLNTQAELPEPLCIQLQQLYGQQAKSMNVLPVQQQKGGTDCGCFAIAFAVSAILGENLSHHIYKQAKMREHLAMCFEQGFFVPFPSTLKRTRSGYSVDMTFTK